MSAIIILTQKKKNLLWIIYFLNLRAFVPCRYQTEINLKFINFQLNLENTAVAFLQIQIDIKICKKSYCQQHLHKFACRWFTKKKQTKRMFSLPNKNSFLHKPIERELNKKEIIITTFVDTYYVFKYKKKKQEQHSLANLALSEFSIPLFIFKLFYQNCRHVHLVIYYILYGKRCAVCRIYFLYVLHYLLGYCTVKVLRCKYKNT